MTCSPYHHQSTTFTRLLQEAEARRARILQTSTPLSYWQCRDRDYDTLPAEKRLRPVEYAAFEYRVPGMDYSASNTAGHVPVLGWCVRGKHRVPVAELYVGSGRVLARSCKACRGKETEARKLIHKLRKGA